ncbi:MAG TPA: caspase family protein, partial [Pseudomonadales bacterium]
YKSALNVWMAAAEAGDADAQTNVGEIFERGLGGEPNYEAALIWYRKAAAQGNARAQFALGTLYEQGLGVERDQREALNWYRLAWGLTEDNLIFESAAKREQEALRAELEKSLEEKAAQLELLQRQLKDTEAKLSASVSANKAAGSDAQREASTLKSLIAQIEAQRAKDSRQIDALPKTREPTSKAAVTPSPGDAVAAHTKDLKFGQYYALLIGNQDYERMERLDTPLNDVALARRILEEKYGFKVAVVNDGDNAAVMQAINDLNDVVGEDDNLLLFYAGHGSRLTAGKTEVGYWLPANAELPPRDTFWVPNEFVTGHLARLKAKRVLVVVDSCYAGLLSSEPSFMMIGDNPDKYADPEFIRFKLQKRARLLLTSGGDQPVLDGGAGNHSIFARAFLDALQSNDGILAAPELYLQVRDRVQAAAAKVEFEQRPAFKTIKSAGHEVGDFFFVPTGLAR